MKPAKSSRTKIRRLLLFAVGSWRMDDVEVDNSSELRLPMVIFWALDDRSDLEFRYGGYIDTPLGEIAVYYEHDRKRSARNAELPSGWGIYLRSRTSATKGH